MLSIEGEHHCGGHDGDGARFLDDDACCCKFQCKNRKSNKQYTTFAVFFLFSLNMNIDQFTLRDLHVGQRATIVTVSETSHACTLLSMGVKPHVEVLVIRISPFAGALYIKIGNNYMAIRKEEAQTIFVKILDE